MALRTQPSFQSIPAFERFDSLRAFESKSILNWTFLDRMSDSPVFSPFGQFQTTFRHFHPVSRVVLFGSVLRFLVYEVVKDLVVAQVGYGNA